MRNFNHRDDSIDPWLLQAIDEIKERYGDECHIQGRSILKFGETNVAFGTTRATIMQFQGSEINETYAEGNTIDSFVGESDDDIGKALTLEGHTVDGSGNMTFVTQPVTHNGVTPVTLLTPLFRANRKFLSGLGTIASPTEALAGTSYTYDSTAAGGVTSGAPDTPSATKLLILAGASQSEKAATSISSTQYWIITACKLAIDKSSGSNVTVRGDMYWRQLGGIFRPAGYKFDLTRDEFPSQVFDEVPYFIIPKNSDVALQAVSSATGTNGFGYMNGVLAKIDRAAL